MPEYDEAVKAAAYAELDELTAEYRAIAAAKDTARARLHEAIVRHLRERNAPPGELSSHTPYDRNHVGRLRAAAGVPTLRPKPITPKRRPRRKRGG